MPGSSLTSSLSASRTSASLPSIFCNAATRDCHDLPTKHRAVSSPKNCTMCAEAACPSSLMGAAYGIASAPSAPAAPVLGRAAPVTGRLVAVSSVSLDAVGGGFSATGGATGASIDASSSLIIACNAGFSVAM